jgi:hypothetical protein
MAEDGCIKSGIFQSLEVVDKINLSGPEIVGDTLIGTPYDGNPDFEPDILYLNSIIKAPIVTEQVRNTYYDVAPTKNTKVLVRQTDNTLKYEPKAESVFKTINVLNQDNIIADNLTDTFTLIPGTNMTIETDNTTNSIKFSSSSGSNVQNIFKTIRVEGHADLIPDTSIDVLKFNQTDNITITPTTTTSVTNTYQSIIRYNNNLYDDNNLINDSLTLYYTDDIGNTTNDVAVVFSLVSGDPNTPTNTAVEFKKETDVDTTATNLSDAINNHNSFSSNIDTANNIIYVTQLSSRNPVDTETTFTGALVELAVGERNFSAISQEISTLDISLNNKINNDLIIGEDNKDLLLVNSESIFENNSTFNSNINVNESLNVDNIKLDGNTISSTDTNGNINITPDGNGDVVISKVQINSGDINGVTIGTTDACTDLRVDNIKIDGNTISSTDANGNINIIPDGEGTVNISKTDISEGVIHDININVGTNKVFNALGSTLIFDNDQISGDAINEGTIDSIAISQLTGDMDCNSQVMTNINIDSGVIDNVTIGTNNPCTELHVDNVKIDENTISSTDNNGNINIIPDGDGIVNISKTNISEGIINNANINDSNITIGTNKVFNVLGSTLIFDNDQISGDAINEGTIDSIAISQLTGEMDCNSQAMTNINIDSGVIDNVTIGTNSPCTELHVDNVKIDGNTISSTDSNGNINIEPHGDGIIDLKKNIKVGTTLLNTDINNGRIGIGTTNPTEKLDVDGNIKVDLLKFNNEVSSFHKVSYIHEGTLKFIQADNQNRVLTSQSGNLEWVSYGTVATGGIDTNDLGILNTPLDADLYIGKDKNNLFISNGQSTFYENVNIINSKLRISSSTGANLVFETSTTNNPVIRSTNNKITFESTDTNETSLIISNLYNNNGTDNYVGDCTIGFLMNGSSNQYTLGVDDSDDKFKIGTSSIDTNTRLTIDSSGNIGIGTTTPTRKLDVIGDIRSGGSHYMLWNTTIGGTGSRNGGSSYGRALVHSQVDSSEATEGNSLLVINYGGDFGSGTRIDGNLGIGINPTSKLHVNGTTNITGVTNINDTTQSDSTATGALIVDGGVGIAENTNIGGVLNVGSNFRLESDGRRLNIRGGNIYGDNTDGLTFYTGNQSNNSSLRLYSNRDALLSGNVTIESIGTADTTLTIKADDTRTASLNLYGKTTQGTPQGTGRVYVGQDINYGGGFLYSGDSDPSTIYSNDTITFFRRDNGSESKVFQYSYGTDHVNFFGNVHLESDKTIQVGTADTTTNLEINPGSNNGNARIGRAFIGYGGVNQDAGFGHITYIGNTSSCALKQTNTGSTVLSSASGQDLFFRIAGSDKMRISGAPATLGNVGIGTTIPSSKLHIYNSAVSNKVVENNVDLLIEDAEARLQIISTDSGAAGSLIALSNVLATPITTPSLTIHQKNWVFHHSGPSQDNKLGIYYRENGEDPDDNNIITDSLYTLSTTGLTLDTSGNVGIGTTSPTDKLHVNGNIKLTGELYFDGERDFSIYTAGSGSAAYLAIKTNTDAKNIYFRSEDNSAKYTFGLNNSSGSSSLGINDGNLYVSGNVGIGLSPTTNKLDVNGHIRAGSDLHVVGNTYYGTSMRQMINLFNNDYGIGIQNSTTYFRSGNDFQFYKGGSHDPDRGNAGGGTALLTIKDSGYVGIGTTSPSAKLHIRSDTTGQNSLLILENNTTTWGGNNDGASIEFKTYETGNQTSRSQAKILIADPTTNDSSNADLVFQTRGNSDVTEKMRISNSGNVGIGTNSPTDKLHLSHDSYDDLGPNIQLQNTVNMYRQSYSNLSNITSPASEPSTSTYFTFSSWNDNRFPRQFLYINRDIDQTNSGSGAILGNDLTIEFGYSNYFLRSSDSTFNPAGPAIRFHTESNERMCIDYQGNVGIGTTNPLQRLEVYPDTNNSAIIGKAHIGDVGHSEYAAFSHFDQVGTTSYALKQSSSGHTFLNSSNGMNIYFRSNNQEKMFLKGSNGNLGIGTTSPSTKLHISGDAEILRLQGSTHSYISFYPVNNTTRYGYIGYTSGGTEDLSIWNQRDGNLKFSTDNTEKMRINSDGNVGIGTNSPSYNLDLYGGNLRLLHRHDSSVYNNFLTFERSSGDDCRINHYCNNQVSAQIDFNGYNQSAQGTIQFNTKESTGTLTNRMLINYNGNVGIGTTNPDEKLEVNGNVKIETTSDATLNIIAHNDNIASINLYGNSTQGTGRVYVGQAISYGGGFLYNGDNNPSIVGDSDYVTFFRRSNGNETAVFGYPHNSSNVEFYGNVGIGTTNPTYKLHVNGTTNITGNTDIGGVLNVGSNFRLESDGTRLKIRGGQIYGDGTDGLTFYTDNQNNNSSLILYSNRDALLRGNVTIESIGTADTTLSIKADYRRTASLNLYGTGGQGTGRVYVGQDINYGGGFLYDGDNSPSIVGSTDHVTFFRRSNGNDAEVFSYTHNSSNVNFYGNVDLNSSSSNNRQFIGYGTIPIGGIIMWNNYNNETVPDGWALCNGDTVNGILTPDLRGRFVMSSTYGDFNVAGEGTANYSVGNSGGEQQVTLTIAEMPSHSHTYTDRYRRADNEGEDENHRSYAADQLDSGQYDTLQTGGDGAHENRPPYYVLAYIMRVY